jgi:hypothetical protein
MELGDIEREEIDGEPEDKLRPVRLEKEATWSRLHVQNVEREGATGGPVSGHAFFSPCHPPNLQRHFVNVIVRFSVKIKSIRHLQDMFQ